VTRTCPTCKCEFEPPRKNPEQTYCSRSCAQSRASGGDSIRLRQTEAKKRTAKLKLSAKQIDALEQIEVDETRARLKAEFLEREQRRAA
jgi:hypothetical protein